MRWTRAFVAIGAAAVLQTCAFLLDTQNLQSSDAGSDGGTNDERVPVAAGNLTGEAIPPSETALQWLDNSNNESGFFIRRRATHGDPTFQTVAQLDAGVTQFIDTGLTYNWQYDYQVIAFNVAGEAPPSNLITVWVRDAG